MKHDWHFTPNGRWSQTTRRGRCNQRVGGRIVAPYSALLSNSLEYAVVPSSLIPAYVE